MSLHKKMTRLLALIGLSAAAVTSLAAPPELSEGEFKELYSKLTSVKSDLWDTIPWSVSVSEARSRAAKEKKPILSWAQNGHPLGGC
jgi:hypothetical protein